MPASSTASLRSLTGATIDRRYLLRRMVGEGGFGAVFESDQQLLGLPVRRVALKLSKQTGIEQDTARELFGDAFLLAQAMDRLEDGAARRHLVHVFDLGIADEHEQRAYVVMEFVDGTTLARQMSSFERVPAPLIVDWVRQACLALRALHRLDPPVLHRDIKPDNILLGVDRAVRLVDFGLAARLLAAGYAPGVVGTTAYMAPETFAGHSVPASDVFSLGLVLYEGLTGEPAFERLQPPPDVPAALRDDWIHEHKRTFRVARPSLRSNTTSPALDALVLACLHFDPRARPRDAGQLLDELAALDRVAPGVDALAEAAALREAGDLHGARVALEDALPQPGLQAGRRYALLRELGAVLQAGGHHTVAAERLVEAWELVRPSGMLRSLAERAALLDEIAACMRADGNSYQAGHYEGLARSELGVSPRV